MKANSLLTAVAEKSRRQPIHEQKPLNAWSQGHDKVQHAQQSNEQAVFARLHHRGCHEVVPNMRSPANVLLNIIRCLGHETRHMHTRDHFQIDVLEPIPCLWGVAMPQHSKKEAVTVARWHRESRGH